MRAGVCNKVASAGVRRFCMKAAAFVFSRSSWALSFSVGEVFECALNSCVPGRAEKLVCCARVCVV